MKLKSLPDDFQVSEVVQLTTGNGPFALYELHKRSLGTPEAIQAVLRSWNLPRQKISYAGLKDRHATTVQFITIHHGPKQDLTQRSFELRYVGQVQRPIGAKDIVANRFSILIRGIARGRQADLATRLHAIQNFGVVNYFDDQRFGSLGVSGRFIAEPWCKGDYEAALWLAIAEPNSHDRPRERQQKEILRQSWGQWPRCKQGLDRSHRRSIVTYLVDHPTDFRRAIGLLRSDLRSLYVAAFQSALWNQWLSRIIAQRCGTWGRHYHSAIGALALPNLQPDTGCTLVEELQWLSALQLPLPSARQHDWPPELVSVLDDVLAQYDLQRSQIRLKYPRDTFFSKGQRNCWLRPRDLQSHWTDDSINLDCLALSLSFDLPRGAYATMLIKQLQTTS
ncbi:MAG: tRNA pseudouridine(13) synthase TruD [Pirellulaceae bacterium]|nr:tRNA pseudouridine(13) synthase TruD [Pirellulaceae bacterium]